MKKSSKNSPNSTYSLINSITFYKYHSLQNDFILLNLSKNKELSKLIENKYWPTTVKKLCHRNSGIGADGVLVLDNFKTKIFNSDGSSGGLCLNGARCIAHYLYTQQNFPKEFELEMGGKKIKSKIINRNKNIKIQNDVNLGQCFGKKIIKTSSHKISGHIVDIGNPHFICESPFDNQPTLKSYGGQASLNLSGKALAKTEAIGKEISQHQVFLNQTNVEFINKISDSTYEVLVYERGCGLTKACGSGSAAIITFLSKEQELKPDKKIKLIMPGGNLIGYWNNEKSPKIVLEASAKFVFSGSIPFDIIFSLHSKITQGDRGKPVHAKCFAKQNAPKHKNI